MPAGNLGVNLSVSPGGIYGVSSAVGTVTLSSPQSSATIVSLSSSNANATVQSTDTVPAGSISANFNITTSAVASNTALAVYASLNGKTVNYGLLVVAPKFMELTFAGSSVVVGGTSKTLTVNLNGPAPAGGISIASSSNSPVAVVLPNLLIPAGSSSASFTMTTSVVTAKTDVTITGVNGISSSQTFHITPK